MSPFFLFLINRHVKRNWLRWRKNMRIARQKWKLKTQKWLIWKWFWLNHANATKNCASKRLKSSACKKSSRIWISKKCSWKTRSKWRVGRRPMSVQLDHVADFIVNKNQLADQPTIKLFCLLFFNLILNVNTSHIDNTFIFLLLLIFFSFQEIWLHAQTLTLPIHHFFFSCVRRTNWITFIEYRIFSNKLSTAFYFHILNFIPQTKFDIWISSGLNFSFESPKSWIANSEKN